MTLFPWLPLWLVLAVPIALLTRAVRGRGPLVSLGAHLAALAGCGFVDAALRRFVAGSTTISFPMTVLYFADLTLLSYVGIVLATGMALARGRLVAVEQRAIAGRERLARARMRWLESQLQPHFLFNTINTILEVAEISRPAARSALMQLHGALRVNLRDGASSEVTLADELADLDAYLVIQQLRFADWLTVQRQIDPAALSLAVPRLLLQPLVENAIRHGLTGRSERGTITIAAHLSARERLVVSVSDNGDGLRRPHAIAAERLGLSNVRARLETIFGRDFTLQLESTRGFGTSTIIDLPARSTHASSALDTRAAAVETPLPDESDAPARTTADMNTVSSASASTSASTRRSLHPAVTGVLLWLAWGLFWSHQSYGYLALRGRLGEQSYVDIVLRDGAAALLWALLSIPIGALVRRSALSGLWTRPAVLGLAGLAAAPVHAFLFLALARGAITIDALVTMLPSDFLLYGIIVLVALRRSIERWIHERELRLSRDGEALARAQLDAGVLRTGVEAMEADLVRAADIIVDDVDRAAAILVAMADRLRAMLDAERAVMRPRDAGLLAGEALVA